MTERAMNMKAKRFLELQEEVKELEEQMEALKAEMQEGMNKAEKYETNKYKFLWPIISKTAMDTKAFKAEHPDLFNIFSKTSSYRKFSVAVKA